MQHIEYGNSLAMRGATHAAQQEFYQALHILTEFLDAQHQTGEFTKNLSAGLMALEDADDFLADIQLQERNIAAMIAAHHSQILTPEEARTTAPIQAMQAYYRFAEQRLSDASNGSPAASSALYSLGKLLLVSARHDPNGHPIDQTKAMVMFRSSLAADGSNHRSANELGVLMAQNGRLEQAKQHLLESLRCQPTVEAWQNLAKVHEHLGETRLAQLARSEELAFQQTHSTTLAKNSVRWVDSQTFDQKAAQRQSFQPPQQPVQRVADSAAQAPRKESQGFQLFPNLRNWF